MSHMPRVYQIEAPVTEHDAAATGLSVSNPLRRVIDRENPFERTTHARMLPNTPTKRPDALRPGILIVTMHTLSPIDCRVLSVLVEKALTVPAQYPLSLNAVTAGCNQKNNRDPVMNVDEDDVLSSLDRLRPLGLVRELMPAGGRVVKYRHLLREALEISLPEMVVLTELLLRGPQTAGELRGRASRMHPLESVEVVENILAALAGRTPPFVARLSPGPGSRAARFAQLLCPGLHPTDAPAAHAPGTGHEPFPRGAPSVHAADVPVPEPLIARIDALEQRVAALEEHMKIFEA